MIYKPSIHTRRNQPQSKCYYTRPVSKSIVPTSRNQLQSINEANTTIQAPKQVRGSSRRRPSNLCDDIWRWHNHLETRVNFGHTLKELGRLDAAVPQSVEYWESRIRRTNIKCARTLEAIGTIHLEGKQFSEALSIQQSVLRVYEEEFGKGSLKTLDHIACIGSICLHQGRQEDAIKEFQRVLAMTEAE
jgi:tetratricopeptide (TPR) repeat protein